MSAPKGKLLIIGGAEDIGENDFLQMREKNKAYERFEILNELLLASRNKKIEIITTGSLIQDEVKKRYQKAFKKINCPAPGFLPINDKLEANDERFLKRIRDAGAIFFTGGDQFRLSTILGGTPVIDIIKKRYKYEKDFLVAGTSAGAMAMSGIMITSGGKEEALLGSDLKTTSGLGLLRNCIIDTHFIKRGRFGRLAHAVIINPGLIGIGLGEDTALIIKNGVHAECRGSGMVVIIDGKNIRQTNITDAAEGEPVYVENFKVHLLVKGCKFSIKTRRLAKPGTKFVLHVVHDSEMPPVAKINKTKRKLIKTNSESVVKAVITGKASMTKKKSIIAAAKVAEKLLMTTPPSKPKKQPAIVKVKKMAKVTKQTKKKTSKPNSGKQSSKKKTKKVKETSKTSRKKSSKKSSKKAILKLVK